MSFYRVGTWLCLILVCLTKVGKNRQINSGSLNEKEKKKNDLKVGNAIAYFTRSTS